MSTLKHECNKNFYVSPFIGMKGKYLFTNKLDKEKINLIIDLYDANNDWGKRRSDRGRFDFFSRYFSLFFVVFRSFL